jgi:hypothetical protein
MDFIGVRTIEFIRNLAIFDFNPVQNLNTTPSVIRDNPQAGCSSPDGPGTTLILLKSTFGARTPAILRMVEMVMFFTPNISMPTIRLRESKSKATTGWLGLSSEMVLAIFDLENRTYRADAPESTSKVGGFGL